MATQNRINVILNQKGFKKYTPTVELLDSLDLTLHRFNKIIENKVDLTATEMHQFSKWLKVDVSDLLIHSIDDAKNQMVAP